MSQLENLDTGLQSKEKFMKYIYRFLRRKAARTSRLIKVRKEVIREKMWVIQTILERVENNTLTWYEQVVCTEDNRWPKRIITWSSEGNNEDN